MIILVLLLLGIANGQVSLYFYPKCYSKVTVPSRCKLFGNEIENHIKCKCEYKDLDCRWEFNEEDIHHHMTFNSPLYNITDIKNYGLEINKGINEFKVNYKNCNERTCYHSAPSHKPNDESPNSITISCYITG
jgi:hypothetical protein